MPTEKAAPILILFLIIMVLAGGCANANIDETRSSLATPKSLSDYTYMTIQIDSDGLYSVDLDQFGHTGIEIKNRSSSDYHLSEAGTPIPIYLSDTELIFYGRAPDNRYSTRRTYRLQVGEPGKMMDHSPLPSAELSSIANISRSFHFEENFLYDSSASGDIELNGEVLEPWFWQTIQVGSAVEIEVELPVEPVDSAELRLGLWGVTENHFIEPDHDLDVVVNGEYVSQIAWDGKRYYSGTLSLPNSLLSKGTNTITLDNSGDGSASIDISRVDWVDLSFMAQPVAVEDVLQITSTQGKVQASGFSDRPLVVDVSNKDEPILLSGWDYDSGSVTLPVSKDMELLLVGPDGLLDPASVDNVVGSDLRNNNEQADMIIVTTDDLVSPLQPLIAAREAQSLNVRLVTLNEIYEEFGTGQNGPDTISDFIRYAYNDWDKPSPRYLFLVGEASYDYQSYLGGGPTNIIPAPMVPVRYSGETVSDNLLGDMDGDHKPDLAVGRWPVDNPKAVEALVARTLAYEMSEVSDSALFIADGSSQEFADLNQKLANESGFRVDKNSELASSSDEELINSWNQGAWLVTYVGHGSMERWGKQGVLTNSAVAGLDSSTAPPIVLQLTCLTGYFAHPFDQSISETLLLDESGPVLVIAATSLTLSESQQPFGINILRQLLDPAVIRIGDALVLAKADLNVSDPGIQEISDTFGLLGDPATIIARP